MDISKKRYLKSVAKYSVRTKSRSKEKDILPFSIPFKRYKGMKKNWKQIASANLVCS